MTEKYNAIYLKCSACEDAHNYESNDQEIIALEAGWYTLESKSLLAEKPTLNQEYEVFLNGPLQLNLTNNFWSIYTNPHAHLEGFETEKDIQSVEFCFCEPIGVIETNDHTALVKIKVLKKVNLVHALKLKPFPARLLEEFNSLSPSSRYCNVDNYKEYALIIANMEGDIGLTVIVKKEYAKNSIVAINEWDFHKNIWHSSSEKLSKEQSDKFGI